jgi:CubicO group peptidase (beta-lactamase class C family)
MPPLLLCALALTAPADDLPARIDAAAAEAVRVWRVPGAAVVVVRDGRPLLMRGYGVRKAGADAPVTPDTVFPLASCTKAFTACLAGRLVDAGKLGWDDPVRRHLSAFRLADPTADADCRLRDLLCHRTGLAGHDLLWYRAPWGLDESVRRAGLLPAARPFRSGLQYQSVMWMAAGRALERAGGEPWGAAVRRGLLEPLGMTATVATSAEAVRRPDVATGHRLTDAGVAEVMPPYPQPTPNPAGSLHGTARDLARWVTFQLGDGTFRGTRVLSAASLAETHAPQVVIPMPAGGLARALNPETVQLSYALGWVVQDYRGRRLVSHAGAIDGFRAHIALLPEQRCGVAIFTNLHQTRMPLALANTLGDLLLGAEPRDWNAEIGRVAAAEDADRRAALKGKTPARPLTAYAGTFRHPAYGDARVRVTDGALTWAWESFRVPLLSRGGDDFLLAADEITEPAAAFEVTDGRATALKLFGLRWPRAGE